MICVRALGVRLRFFNHFVFTFLMLPSLNSSIAVHNVLVSLLFPGFSERAKRKAGGFTRICKVRILLSMFSRFHIIGAGQKFLS